VENLTLEQISFGDRLNLLQRKYKNLVERDAFVFFKEPRSLRWNYFTKQLKSFFVTQRADVQSAHFLRITVALVNLALRDSDLVVRNSTIFGAGKGLFARRTFRAGERITVYGGITSNYNPNDGLPPSQQSYYVIQSDEGVFLDGYRYFKLEEAGRWINTRKLKPNAEFVEEFFPQTSTLKVDIVALRDIAPTEEIFVYYGEEFVILPAVIDLTSKCHICRKHTSVGIDAEANLPFCGRKCQKEYYQLK